MSLLTRRAALGTVIFAGIAGATSVAHFWRRKGVVDVIGFPPLQYPSFQTWPTPRDFDGPGTIFNITDNNFIYRGGSSKKPFLAGNEILADIQTRQEWKVGLLEQFLGSILSLKGSSAGDINAHFEATGAQRWRTHTDAVVKELKPLIEKYIDQPLYLIVEAISVKSLSYTVNSNALHKEAIKINTAASGGSVDVKRAEDGSDRFILSRKFDRPYYVFYRAQRIELLSGMESSQIIVVDQDESLQWKMEYQ
jgi:hypothetical protein